ncbi:hypothetical protein VB834_01810 [Limnoraphis robusta Tam1]|uniref:hypothetical protein n=1 Tax=Limnoraphis robusta TaxID=1118279 RepID=UPI002B206523|nr:hypothetical protein [Limnoraphis robusta]MEA5497365.1 hypothetical protein [Limnoraphis robusta BA-68 BA1]MEA5537763.1 hypothetical protein [Limnoraphis robusta Tam1]
MTIRKDERLLIAAIGEYYLDLLNIDAWINQRARSTQASSLLCSKLMQREPIIRERVAYLAKKRGISSDEMWFQILRGTAERIDNNEITFPDGNELDIQEINKG